MRTKQIHSKIYLELQHRITSGGLKPGDLLPSEAELCEEFDASRGPVRQAIASLRAEGLISSGRGRRSVVLGTSKADSFMSILSNFAWMKEHDLNPTSKILWMAR
ncbi:GntR family transcriptional regulator, partial [Corynebacterium casei]